MILTLRRTSREFSGVFGALSSDTGDFSCVTLEHAYPVFDNNVTSKIPVGTYTCKRGWHRLEGMADQFETFEVIGIPGHTDILYHWGNYNSDSSGCILLGQAVLAIDYRGSKMISESKLTFQKFMSSMEGLDSFTLIVC